MFRIIFVKGRPCSCSNISYHRTGGARRDTDRELFFILFCILIIFVVTLYLPGVYYLNTVHETFLLHTIDKSKGVHLRRSFLPLSSPPSYQLCSDRT